MLARYEHRQEIIDPASVWLECDARARIILDAHLRVRWINSAASRMIRNTEAFEIHNNMLRVRACRWASNFEAFVHAATIVETLLCVQQSSGEHIICTAIDLNMGGLLKFVGLTLRCTTQSSLFDGAAFAKVFHLTSTERRVVEALFAGQTAEQIGGEFGISIGTVRAHIRHIYEKLGVASREALFHKALPFFSPS